MASTAHDQAHSRRRSVFRPCIDLHQGVVKQIVGGTLRDEAEEAKERALAASSAAVPSSSSLKTNFTSELGPAHYAQLYKANGLTGAHVIKLGPGNDDAAREALASWRDGMQIGGGITVDNASYWIEQGAHKVGAEEE